MTLPPSQGTLVANSSAHKGSALSAAEAEIAGQQAPAIVREYLDAFPDYEATPLVCLPGLAASLGVASLDLKDEGQRYGLFSFKALGGSYAVARLVHRFLEARLGRKVEPAEMLSDESKAVAAQMTVACATDGNHGRSVAAGAQKFGCRCVIFLHRGVSRGRERAIAQFGAEIRRTAGNYDQSVAEATETAAKEGWTTVSDFSWPGYEEIPGLVMQGYTLMLEEIFQQASAPYTHVFVQGGVGGLAAVVAGYFHDRLGENGPRIIVVEPDRANCLQRSATAGQLVAMAAEQPTVMAMLECYEPSLVAWQILEKTADDYLTIGDGSAIKAMRVLADPVGGDPALVIGESGGAGLAGLQTALSDATLREKLGLGADSRVLLFGTEGATDPGLYEALVSGDTKTALDGIYNHA
ncbi:diaminopropionate ammonia-lyase [Pseudohoeflea coraliihabitans]|uniref:Diaminopropionate ammonia-lyase n=1 Tax=Pseudohoeflea coraliihabitans TaxID=2860393 RepID=A0ABS6WLA5_9HYPH|nr:diaminopropionate ammonia-lyase [Pseudohoeflea sp. DP4N28-3]MBW3095849.1 diaminopropionate ammonia-lyase [Pseudohoeflea sp. DP4N28-3]